MTNLPSKELLSAVLGIEIDTVFGLFDDKVFRFNTPIDDYTVSINIHELAFLTRDYLDEKYSIYLSLDRSLKSFFTEANRVYEELYNET